MTTRILELAPGQSTPARLHVSEMPARPGRSLLGQPGGTRQAVQRFGTQIDVRNRGALRLGPSMRSAASTREQPAVVRMWHGEQCRELSAHEARALAAQLSAAALYAEQQNAE